MAHISYSEKIQRKTDERKNAYGAKSTGKQVQTPKKPAPVESHRMCLIPPASNYDNMCEVWGTEDALSRLSAQSFYWGPVM